MDLIKSVLKYTEYFNIETQWRYEMSWKSKSAPGDHTTYFVFNEKMIIYRHIWLKF